MVNLSGKLCNHFKRGFKCWKRIYELKLFQSALAIDEELSPICLSTALDSRLPHPLCSRLLFPQYGAPVALSPPFFRITVTHRVRLTIHEQYNGEECLTERRHHPCDEKWSYLKISPVLGSDTDMFSNSWFCHLKTSAGSLLGVATASFEFLCLYIGHLWPADGWLGDIIRPRLPQNRARNHNLQQAVVFSFTSPPCSSKVFHQYTTALVISFTSTHLPLH